MLSTSEEETKMIKSLGPLQIIKMLTDAPLDRSD